MCARACVYVIRPCVHALPTARRTDVTLRYRRGISFILLPELNGIVCMPRTINAPEYYISRSIIPAEDHRLGWREKGDLRELSMILRPPRVNQIVSHVSVRRSIGKLESTRVILTRAVEGAI